MKKRKLNRKVSEIVSQRVEEGNRRRQLLAGSQSKIAMQSLKCTVMLEKRYADEYGKNWRRDLPYYQVNEIEKEICRERNSMVKGFEDNLLRTKLHGYSLVKRRK